jgi:RNA polymerase sigma-70 factor (ECF subfamily)
MPSSSPRDSHTHTTRWDLVLAAGSTNSATARPALEWIYKTYRYRVYRYIRQHGHNADEADDLTQDFFTDFLERRWVKTARPDRGLFRAFVTKVLKHFLIDVDRRRRRQKRGGDRLIVSLDFADLERRHLAEPPDTRTPEQQLDRAWALDTMELVVRKLRREYVDRSRGAEFDALRPCLFNQLPEGGYRAVGETLGINEEAARSAAKRLRRRCYRLLGEHLAEPGADKEAVDEEIRFIIDALRP